MDIQKIRVVSNNISYGPPPLPEDEVEQNLTISANGRVWFTSYIYGSEYGKFLRTRKLQIFIGKEKAEHILSLISKYAESKLMQLFATGIGGWNMTITDINENKRQLEGSLCGGIIVEDIDMTNLICSTLSIDNLFVFSGLDNY